MTTADRPHRIALIGAAGFGMKSDDYQIECFPWRDVKRLKNIKDFDGIIIDLTSSEDVSPEEWSSFFEALNARTAFDLLESGASVIIMGDPRIECSLDKSNRAFMKFLGWSMLNYAWDNRPGTTIILSTDAKYEAFMGYLRNLTRWDYSLTSCGIDEETLTRQVPVYGALMKSDYVLDVATEEYAHNRYGGSLSFSTRLVVYERQPAVPIGEKLVRRKTFGSVLFLPQVDLTQEEAISSVLSDICGVEISVPEPEWLKMMKAPGQKELEEKEAAITEKIATLQSEREELGKHIAESRECLKLLYERGSELEDVVRNTLRQLGASVEEPDNPGNEDGWIIVTAGGQELKMVLEVKGTRNDQFGEGGIRQLLDWMQQGIMNRGEKSKGVFIGNSCIDKAVEDRPQPFSKNWVDKAEVSQIAAMTTTMLFNLFLLNLSGKLDQDRFWLDLFNTEGIFDASQYAQ